MRGETSYVRRGAASRCGVWNAVVLTSLAALAGGAVGPASSAARTLPQQRAYELVSPVFKNGNDAAATSPTSRESRLVVSPDGERVTWISLNALPGDRNGFTQNGLAGRRADGWSFTGLSPTPGAGPGAEGKANAAPTTVFMAFSRNVGAGLYRDLSQGPGAQLAVRREDGTTALIASDPAPIGDLANGTIFPRLLSGDGRHALFVSRQPLAPIPGLPPAPGTPLLYRWSDDGGAGHLDLVNVGDDGSLIAPAAGADVINTDGGFIGGSATALAVMRNALSEDGARVFFQSPPVSGPLYMRHDARTTELSAPDPGQPAATDVKYLGATSDGRNVWFGADSPLTALAPDGSQRAVYRYDTANGKLTWIWTPPSGEELHALLPSDDGSRVFFTTDRFDPATGETRQTIYTSAEPGQARVVAADVVVAADSGTQMLRDSDIPTADVTPDGRYLAYQVRRHVGDDSLGAPIYKSEIYRYDAVTATTIDVSTAPGIALFSGHPQLSGENATTRMNVVHEMSRDGSTIFFDTDAALDPADTNQRRDVYAWTEGAARPALISAGTGDDDSLFSGLDATERGVNAFFITRDRLVARDGDELMDLYDARIGGGFPERAADPPCSGEDCRAFRQQPDVARTASETFSGAGNLGRARRVTFAVTPFTAPARASLLAGRRALLAVRVTGAGTLTVRMFVRYSGTRSNRRVATVRRTARGAGRVSIPLRLGRAVASRLRKRGGTLSVTVTHSRAARSRTIALRVARAHGTRSSAAHGRQSSEGGATR